MVYNKYFYFRFLWWTSHLSKDFITIVTLMTSSNWLMCFFGGGLEMKEP